MVESAEDRSDSDSAVPPLQPRSRRLQAEAAMGAIVVVVMDELGQDRAQVALAEGVSGGRGTRGERSSPSAPQSSSRGAPESASADS